MATTDTIRMPARLMGSMGRSILWAACLSVRGDTGDSVGSAAEDSMGGLALAEDSAGRDLEFEEGADSLEVGSAVTARGDLAEADSAETAFAVEAGFMAAVDSTVAVDSMVAGTGKVFGKSLN